MSMVRSLPTLVDPRRTAWAFAFGVLCSGPVVAQKSAGPPRGTLIVDGGGAIAPIVRRFVELAGGHAARIVVIVTGPSALRFGDQNIVLNPDWPRERKEWGQYEDYLKGWLGIDSVQLLHTRDRGEADTEAFVAPLK